MLYDLTAAATYVWDALRGSDPRAFGDLTDDETAAVCAELLSDSDLARAARAAATVGDITLHIVS